MKDMRETIRFNSNSNRDMKLYSYLEKVKGRRRGAFIKEAMEMYIEAIELGHYNCPYFEEENNENKFREILNQRTIKQHLNDEEIKEKIEESKEEMIYDHINNKIIVNEKVEEFKNNFVSLNENRNQEKLELNLDEDEF